MTSIGSLFRKHRTRLFTAVLLVTLEGHAMRSPMPGNGPVPVTVLPITVLPWPIAIPVDRVMKT